MELSLHNLPQPVTIRLVADFDVQVKPSRLTGLTTQQKSLLQAIGGSPTALRRIARMSAETDLAGIIGSQLDNVFQGPSNEDLFDVFMTCLSDPERAYWKTFKERPDDALHNEVMPVFLAFVVIFRRAGIEDPAAESTSTRKTVGPTLDAHTL